MNSAHVLMLDVFSVLDYNGSFVSSAQLEFDPSDVTSSLYFQKLGLRSDLFLVVKFADIRI